MYKILNIILAIFIGLTALEALEHADLISLSGKATKKQFPDADSVLLYSREDIVYQADGTGITVDEFYQKVLTEAGRKKLRDLNFYFNSTYEKLELEVLEVVKSDGRRIPVDLKRNSKLAVESSQMSSNIYDPAQKKLTAGIPDLQLGDMIHVRTREHILKPRIPGQWSNVIVLQADIPILHTEVKIDAPSERPLNSIAVKSPVPNTVKFEKKDLGKRILYQWITTNVPQVLPEPDMPPLYTCVQRLLVSTAVNWKEIAQWYEKISAPRMAAITLEMRLQVKKLLSGALNDESRVQALFQFVSQQIRYMGITAENEAPGYEPHDVSLTFERRHGVCRDKAALLAAMLRIAGFKAYPVLFMAGVPKDEDIPNIYFNHSIVAWEKTPGNYQLMDPTFEATAELFPATLSNQSYLVANGSDGKLRRSPIVPATKNVMHINVTAELKENGSLTGKAILDFGGVNDLFYRGAFLRWAPEYRRQFFASQLKKSLPGAELTDFDIRPHDLQNIREPLKAELKFNAAGLLRADASGIQLFPMPEFSRVFGAVNFILGCTGLAQRRFNLLVDTACRVKEKIEIKLPLTYQIEALPKAVNINVQGVLSRKREFNVISGVLQCENLFSLDTVEIVPKDYLLLKNALKKIHAGERGLPVVIRNFRKVAPEKFTQGFSDADSLVLTSELKVNIKDLHNWSSNLHVRRKILNYGGVKKFSELKIPYNPVWQKPEVKAVVIVNGKKIHPQRGEFTTMDAAWSAAAPRYPAGKILVVSLPGVEPGAEIDYTVTMNNWDMPFFSMTVPFAGYSPRFFSSFEVEYPEKSAMRISPALPGIEGKRLLCKDRVVWKFYGSDIPKIPVEPGQPPVEEFTPSISASNGNYHQFGAELEKALNNMVEHDSPETDKLSARLKGDLIAIRNYVSKEIRAAGPALNELPWSAFSPPDVTMNSGYGTSADRAILLARLLKKSDIEYRFVASSNNPYLGNSVRRYNDYPINEFEEILLYLPGRDIYLNDTGEYAAPGAIRGEGHIGLDLRTGRLQLLRPARRFETQEERNYKVVIDSSGNALITVTELLYGNNFETMNRYFATLTPEKRRRYFMEKGDELTPGAVITGTAQTDFSRYPGRIVYTVKIANYLAEQGVYRALELPEFTKMANAVATASTKRTTPWRREHSLRIVCNYEIELPESGIFEWVRMRPPYNVRGRGNVGEYVADVRRDRRRGTLRTRLSLPAGELTPAEYSELVGLQRYLSNPATRRLLFRKVSNVTYQGK